MLADETHWGRTCDSSAPLTGISCRKVVGTSLWLLCVIDETFRVVGRVGGFLFLGITRVLGVYRPGYLQEKWLESVIAHQISLYLKCVNAFVPRRPLYILALPCAGEPFPSQHTGALILVVFSQGSALLLLGSFGNGLELECQDQYRYLLKR